MQEAWERECTKGHCPSRKTKTITHSLALKETRECTKGHCPSRKTKTITHSLALKETITI